MPHETTHRFLASELPVAEPESCLFHVLPVPLEATVSYAGGTARGPEAILEASDQLELWDGESVPAEAGIYTWPAVDISGSPETVLGRVEAAVGGILDCNGLPVLLGGGIRLLPEGQKQSLRLVSVRQSDGIAELIYEPETR